MISQYVTKRNVLAILAGCLSIFALAILRSQIYFYAVLPHANMASFMTGHEISSFESPYNVLYIFLAIFAQLENPIGGFIAGLIARDKGWLYGAAVGLLLPVMSILVNLAGLFLPSLSTPDQNESARLSLAFGSIARNLAGLPMTMVMTGIGGLAADFIRYRKKSQSNTTQAAAS